MFKPYERRETADQIVFEFRYLPLVSLIFFLALAAMLAPGCRATRRVLRKSGILLIVWMIGLLPAWMELEKAMSSGSVVCSGSKFSFSNPLKVVISKT